MSRLLKLLPGLVFVLALFAAFSQTPAPVKKTAKLEIYYFHPTERCPIDLSIEETARKMMQTDFAREVKDGTILFRVLNTDDKANAKTVARFEMNAQALYLVTIVKGKEVKKDLTEFAFSNSQSNPGKFKAGLKEEITGALK